jgi:outer membrane protein TolC
MAALAVLAWTAGAQEPPPVLTLSLADALQRAHANSQQLLSADIAARLAHEDRVQAKAALLPTLNWDNGFVYTQPNGTDTGVFVANNGPRVYSRVKPFNDVTQTGLGWAK